MTPPKGLPVNNSAGTPILNRAEFRNSEWEFALGWAVERSEFRPKTGSSLPSLGILLSEFSSDEACCSAANTAQTGLFLSRVVVCIHMASFSFAVVVTTPNRRVIPSNTLAYQRSVSYAAFCENYMLLRTHLIENGTVLLPCQ